MSTLTLATGRPVLADRIFSRTITLDLVLIAAGAAFTAVMAQLFIPIEPVPITGQTIAVLIVGSTLGAVRGALSLTLYALIGLVLPVFSEGTHGFDVLFGATGGYIVGFIFSAALTGWLAQRQWDHKILGAIASFLAGTVVTFIFGMTWLAIALGLDFQQTLEFGLFPFVLTGIIKAVFAAAVIRLVWFAVNSSDARKSRRDTTTP